MVGHFLADMAQQTSTVKKPNYNQHFPRSFMLNYEAVLQDLSDEKILLQLKDFNREWLSQPNIAISEMAQTIKDNWPLIEKNSGKVFTRKFVQELGEVILALMDSTPSSITKTTPHTTRLHMTTSSTRWKW